MFNKTVLCVGHSGKTRHSSFACCTTTGTMMCLHEGTKKTSRSMCGLFIICLRFVNKNSTVLLKQATTENPHLWKWQFGSFLQMWNGMQLLTAPCRDVCHPSSKPFVLPAQGTWLPFTRYNPWVTHHVFFSCLPFLQIWLCIKFFILKISGLSSPCVIFFFPGWILTNIPWHI